MNNLNRLVKHYRHINWALIDQALVSGTNFFTGILLARFLGVEEFGLFTLAWSVTLFLYGVQLAIIVNPMVSIGPKEPEEKMEEYYGAMLLHQFFFSLFAAFLFFLVYVAMNFLTSDLLASRIIFPLGCASVAFLLQDFVRRYFFSCGKPRSALFNDVVSYVGQIGLLLWCFNNVQMDSARVLWAVSSTSLLAIILGIREFPSLRLGVGSSRATWRRNWRFSRWLLGSSIMQWLSGNLFLIAAGGFLGVMAVGAIKSAQNMMGGAHILFQGFENSVPVEAARRLSLGGAVAVQKYLKQTTFIGMCAVIGIGVVLGFKPSFWMSALYGDQFEMYGYVLTWYTFIYPVVFLSLMLRIWLRTLENTRPIFIAYVFMVLAGAILVYPLIKYFEIGGIMFGILITNVVMVLSLALFLKRFI